MPIQFIYFDLGNVLLSFCHETMCRQMAEVAQVDQAQVHKLLFESDSQDRFETGELDLDSYYEHFCQLLGRRPEQESLQYAASDIFAVREPITPIVAALAKTDIPMAILSNTNEAHWNFLSDGRFADLVPGPFDFAVLSFEERSMKPDQQIYRTAIDRAGVSPENIFFVDDRPENVEGARQAGIDAVQFYDEQQLIADLREREIPLAL